jgi:hypothetical protein
VKADTGFRGGLAELWRMVQLAMITLVGLIGLAFVANYASEHWHDWVPQQREVQVFFNAPKWVVGESKICSSFVADEKGEVASLFCDETHESHQLEVTFWGSITANQAKVWKCKRESESIECKLQ